MKISDVFANKKVVESAIVSSYAGALGSDVKGFFGTSFEIELMKQFNGLGNGYKLLTVEATKKLIERVGTTFDFNGLCSSIEELIKRTKQVDDSLSMTDLLLFQEKPDCYQLVDWSSCKTSNDSSSKAVKLHNDSEGLIHESLLGNVPSLNNIGKVHMVFYDHNGFSCFSFDGDYVKLSKQMNLVRQTESQCIYEVKGVTCRRQQVITKSRNKQKKGSKSTSFNRGIDLDKEVIKQCHSVFQKISDGSISRFTIDEAFQNRIGL